MGAAVVACVDAAPVLQATEHVFDAVSLAVENGIVRDRYPARAGRGDAGRYSALGQCAAEAIAVLTAVAKQFAGRRQDGQ